MANTYNTEFNKNSMMVYTEEPGFTGYKGLDFTKLDDIETLLASGANLSLSGANLFLSGIAKNTQELNDKIFSTGDSYPSGVKGTVVYQADLSAQYDNVDIAGYAGADLSGIYSRVDNNFPVYSSIELKYNAGNNTGVFYKDSAGVVVRKLQLLYDGSNNVTGIYKTDY